MTMSHFTANSVTVTSLGQKQLVEFVVQTNAEGAQETVSVTVSIPSKSDRTVAQTQKDAAQRAIDLLQIVLKGQP
ncbi:hypothetical protein [Noviherbaspirillum malthae]|uniref:hypothetical protein n=1 Tax=Noviherbaspirillum malthae TaxID=1260987 RepID=UPI00188EBCD8|nr:hypothetical protein [Noviherbaspirillum malthae]